MLFEKLGAVVAEASGRDPSIVCSTFTALQTLVVGGKRVSGPGQLVFAEVQMLEDASVPKVLEAVARTLAEGLEVSMTDVFVRLIPVMPRQLFGRGRLFEG
jgi:hypothetical protein